MFCATLGPILFLLVLIAIPDPKAFLERLSDGVNSLNKEHSFKLNEAEQLVHNFGAIINTFKKDIVSGDSQLKNLLSTEESFQMIKTKCIFSSDRKERLSKEMTAQLSNLNEYLILKPRPDMLILEVTNENHQIFKLLLKTRKTGHLRY